MKLLIFTSNPNTDRGSFKDRIGVYLDVLRAAGIEPTVAVLEPSAFKRFRQFHRMDNYDVVLLHKKCLNFLDGLFFRPRKARVIFNYDDAVMFNDNGRQTYTHRKRFQRSLWKAGKVLVGSSYLAQQADGHKDVVVLPLGLKTEGYRCADAEKNDDKIRLVWVGRPVTLNYLEPLKSVLQKLARQYPHLVLRLICEEFIDIDGVAMEKIVWTPRVRYQALAEADIGLAPLPDNLFTRGKCSFKVLEYSASGIPVVASPVGTNPDHVKDGRTGYLANTEDEWYTKLRTLIENKPLRTEMGQNGRAYAAEFDVSIVGQKLCNLIKSMND